MNKMLNKLTLIKTMKRIKNNKILPNNNNNKKMKTNKVLNKKNKNYKFLKIVTYLN